MSEIIGYAFTSVPFHLSNPAVEFVNCDSFGRVKDRLKFAQLTVDGRVAPTCTKPLLSFVVPSKYSQSGFSVVTTSRSSLLCFMDVGYPLFNVPRTIKTPG